MQDQDTARAWREPARAVRILLTARFTERNLVVRIFVAMAIVIAALTAVSGLGRSLLSGSHISIAASGICPDTMVWDSTNCVNG
jgi:hypothetical protein